MRTERLPLISCSHPASSMDRRRQIGGVRGSERKVDAELAGELMRGLKKGTKQVCTMASHARTRTSDSLPCAARCAAEPICQNLLLFVRATAH